MILPTVAIYAALISSALQSAHGWVPLTAPARSSPWVRSVRPVSLDSRLLSTKTEATTGSSTAADVTKQPAREEIPYDYTVPDDAVIHIKPWAMRRLRELRSQQMKGDTETFLVLRMGVRSGGCSGMSYVMDFAKSNDAVADDDQVDTYEQDKIQCIVDAKSMLYLYGLELDYSPELIGGGFRFYNPNAEESCGCGSSFGV